MIEAEERQKLEELRAKVACSKHMVCVHSSLADLCEGRYHADLDVLECLEKGAEPCQFAKLGDGMLVCGCPLRQYIARNFERWTSADTALVRRAP